MSNQNIFEATKSGNFNQIKKLIEKERININKKDNVNNFINFFSFSFVLFYFVLSLDLLLYILHVKMVIFKLLSI